MKNYLIAIALLLCCAGLSAQSITVRGTVTNESKAPIEGVSVKLKGGNVGTSTDSLGHFTIAVPNKNAFLVFSHVSFNEKQVPAGNATLNISLQSKTNEGDEVVVIGYGTAKKKDLTGSVGKVNMTDLSKAPVRSFDEALAGRTAGVQVSSADGQPGAGISIVIRGNNSITQANSPLYVVDGFPIEDPNNNVINPADIESLEVLKDASATAIYGARGANGVVMITTKKGKEGPPVISFDAYYGVQQATKKLDLMDPYEFVKYALEMDTTSVSTTPFPTPKQIYLSNGKTLDYYKTVPALDWQEMVLQDAKMSSYNLSINGGNKQTKYSISGSVFDQDGVLINSGYKRYQGRIVLDQHIGNKLKVGINTNYTYLEQSGISPSQSSFSGTNNIMVSVWGARPLSGEATIEDDFQDPAINPASDYRVNPVINLNNLVRLNKSKNLYASAYAEYAILPSLKLRVSGGVTDNTLRNEQFNNSRTQYGHPNSLDRVNGSVGITSFTSWLNENTLTWSNSSKLHAVNVLGGFTAQGGKTSGSTIRATQLPNEELGISGLDEGILQPLRATSSSWTMSSFLGRVNYVYDSKYLFTASFRADGSSKFAEANHWSYFPSAAASWRFSEENWLKGNKVLSNGKLRFSYGATGNNRVSDFGYLSSYGLPIEASYVFNNNYVSGIIPTSLGNTDLKWETTQQSNIGVDLGFLDQRIELSVDAYRKKTSDLLLNAQLPTSSGFSTALKNVGSVQNQGLEFTLNTINVRTRDFSWSSNFNISFNQSKVLGLAEGQESLQSAISWDTPTWNLVSAYLAKLGMPLGQMYGYIWDGVYNYEDFNRTTAGGYILKDNITTNGNTRDKIQPGDIKYRDINGDKVVNASDYTVIGNGLPVHYGGFSNNFTYKNFDLNIFFQWSYGNDIMNVNRLWFNGARISSTQNQYAEYAERWSPENTDSKIYRTNGYFAGGYSSYIIEDGSYLRLKTASLGYNFDNKLLKKLKIRTLRAYISGQNLLTWTNYSGLDPEVSAYNSALTPGFDFSTYPRARTITVGAKISF